MKDASERLTPRTELQTIPADIDIDQLLGIMRDAKLPIDEYGLGAAKTVFQLLSEVNEGETTLTIDQAGKLTRSISVLWVDVLHTSSDGTTHILREDRQEFKDGRVKRRGLDSSLGEKIKPGEGLEDAAQRTLQEELGVSSIASLYTIGFKERTFVPDTFPGLESTYKMHQFVSVISESEYVPEGYIEYQADKTNYYVWDVLEQSGEL